jgi:hypothetical protein
MIISKARPLSSWPLSLQTKAEITKIGLQNKNMIEMKMIVFYLGWMLISCRPFCQNQCFKLNFNES